MTTLRIAVGRGIGFSRAVKRVKKNFFALATEVSAGAELERSPGDPT